MQSYGVSVLVLKRIRDVVGKETPLSTENVIPTIYGWSDGEDLSLCELITGGYRYDSFPDFGYSEDELCGKANIYVCHSRKQCFSALVDELEKFQDAWLKTDVSDAAAPRVFFWIDFLCCRKSIDFSPHDQLRDIFSRHITDIGHTVLVMSHSPSTDRHCEYAPATCYATIEESNEELQLVTDSLGMATLIEDTSQCAEPESASQSVNTHDLHRDIVNTTEHGAADCEFHPLGRMWCLWELAISAACMSELSIVGPENLIQSLMEAKWNSTSREDLAPLPAQVTEYINFAESECSLGVDKEMLWEAGQLFPGGIPGVNSTVRSYLNEWVMSRKLDVIARREQQQQAIEQEGDGYRCSVEGGGEEKTGDTNEAEGEVGKQDPNNISMIELDPKSNEDIYLTCPYEDCQGYIMIAPKQINCGVFRHAVIKSTGRAINPHAPQHKCEKLFAEGKVYGCARPFCLRRIKKDGKTYVSIESCDYN